MNLNGEEYYYISLIDDAGADVVTYSYDSWGKLISIDGSLKDTVGTKNTYRYRGYRYDSETGLYYLQSRYYNPEWSRFINADVITGIQGQILSHNMYAYVLNNFVNLVDPTGFAAEQGVGSSVSGFYNFFKKRDSMRSTSFVDQINAAKAETSVASRYNEPLIYQKPIQSGFWSAVGSGIDYNLKNIEPTTATKYALKGVGYTGGTGIALGVLTDYSSYKAGKNESFSLINSTVNGVLDGVVSGLAIAGGTALILWAAPVIGATAVVYVTGIVIVGSTFAEYKFNFTPSGYIRRKLDF